MEDLETLYSPSAWSVRLSPKEVLEDYMSVTLLRSQEAKEKFKTYKSFRYGKGLEEYFHIFGYDLPADSPVMIYLHGGYWQAGSVEDSCYTVLPFVSSGIVTVVVGYDLAPKVCISEIMEQVLAALAKLEDIMKEKNFGDVWLSGHSAGGQLALSACQYASSDFIKRIKGLILYSGIFDLENLRKMSVNDAMNFTSDEVNKFSPMKHVCRILRNLDKRTQFVIAVGQHDSPAFKQASLDFHQKVLSYGYKSDLKTIENADHFNLVTDLHFEDYSLTKIIKKFLLNRE